LAGPRGSDGNLLRGPPQGSRPNVGSANGERFAEPPRREGRGLPAALRLSDLQRREFQETLLDVDTFEDLPGKWQAAILKAEENAPNLRIVGAD
jgi:hypothetical protein